MRQHGWSMLIFYWRMVFPAWISHVHLLKLEAQASESVMAMMVADRFLTWISKEISEDLVHRMGVQCTKFRRVLFVSGKFWGQSQSKHGHLSEKHPRPGHTDNTKPPSKWHHKNYDMQLRDIKKIETCMFLCPFVDYIYILEGSRYYTSIILQNTGCAIVLSPDANRNRTNISTDCRFPHQHCLLWKPRENSEMPTHLPRFLPWCPWPCTTCTTCTSGIGSSDIPFSTHEVTHPSAAGQCHLYVHGPRVENIHVLANHFHISDIKSQECERWPKAVFLHWVHWIRPRPPYSQQQPLHHLRHGRHVAPSLSLEKLVASPRYWPMLCALFLTAPPLCCMCLLINLPGPTRN